VGPRASLIPLRICIVNTYFHPWRGGAESYVLNLAIRLAQRGHQVHVLCASHMGRPSLEFASRMTVRRLRPLFTLYGVPISPNLLLELLLVKADLIHVNFPNPLNALISGFVARLRRIPAVLTWHNDLPPVTPAASVLVRLHDHLLAPLYAHLYRAIISTSEEYASSSPLLPRFGPRVLVVPNGVDCGRFRPDLDGAPIRRRHGLGDAHLLLFVGALTRWHRYKGLPVLLRAMRLCGDNLRGPYLLVVGDGDQRPAYEALAKSLGIGGRVVFAGEVPDGELPDHYAASDLLVLPSLDRSEGFGVVLLEANACGKPVLASRVGGIPSYVREGVNGALVEPNNPPSLAGEILRLLEGRIDPGACRERAKSYDWSAIVERIEKLYNLLVEGCLICG